MFYINYVNRDVYQNLPKYMSLIAITYTQIENIQI